MRSDPLEIVRPGTQVEIGPPSHPIVGRIDRVSVGSSLHPIYKIEWWAGMEFKSAEFEEDQFRTIESVRPVQIGFLEHHS